MNQPEGFLAVLQDVLTLHESQFCGARASAGSEEFGASNRPSGSPVTMGVTIHGAADLRLVYSGDGIRTHGLKLMRLPSYHCSTPLQHDNTLVLQNQATVQVEISAGGKTE